MKKDSNLNYLEILISRKENGRNKKNMREVNNMNVLYFVNFMTTDEKLRVHTINKKTLLLYGNEPGN